MRTPLGSSFWRLFAASASSNLADGVTRVALPLLAATITRDPLAIGALTALAFLPWLLVALPAGAVVDRVRRTRAMAVANTVRAVALVLLGVTVLTGSVGLPVLYAVAFVIGVAETFYDSAARAVLPQVVRRDQLDRGNGWLTTGESAGEGFVGAPLGSLLFALAAAAPFLANAAVYVVAVVLVLTIAGTARPERTGAPTTIRRDIADGVRWLWGHRFLRGLTAVSGVTSLLSALSSGLLVLFALDTLQLSEVGFGVLLTAFAVGAVVGGLAAAPLAARIGRTTTLVVGAAVAGACLTAIGFVREPWLAGVLLAVEAAAVMFWTVLTMSLRQALIPEGVFGRVQGAYRTLVWGAIPVGSLAGGLLASATSVPAVFVVGGVGQVLVTGWLWRLLVAHRQQVAEAFAEPVAA